MRGRGGYRGSCRIHEDVLSSENSLKELRKPSRRDAIECLVAGTAALGALHSGCAGLAPVPSPSDLERGHPATNAWQLARPAMGREIERYASQASVNRGESRELFVNGTDPNYSGFDPQSRMPVLAITYPSERRADRLDSRCGLADSRQ
jgi:hypothetical protein